MQHKHRKKQAKNRSKSLGCHADTIHCSVVYPIQPSVANAHMLQAVITEKKQKQLSNRQKTNKAEYV